MPFTEVKVRAWMHGCGTRDRSAIHPERPLPEPAATRDH